MKKLLFKIMVLTAICAMTSCSDNILSDDGSIPVTKASSTEQKDLTAIGINLMESFNATPLRSNTLLYPDYYCGAYIDNNNFVILVNKDTALYKDNFIQRTKSNDFILKLATYSMNELNETLDLLNSFMFNEVNKSIIEKCGLESFGLLPNKNRIFIELNDCNEEKITQFKGLVMDSPMLVFEKSVDKIMAHAEVYPGEECQGSGVGSFGYRARSNGSNGIVASGHVVRSYGESVYGPEGFIGTCTNTMIGGSVDAAFVQANNPSNYTFWQNIYISSYVETPFQGANVTMEGKNNHAGLRSQVIATNVTGTITIPSMGIKVTLYGLTKANYPSQDGDSGGLVYSGSNNIYGIHEAAGGGYSYFISASEINRTMNLTTY